MTELDNSYSQPFPLLLVAEAETPASSIRDIAFHALYANPRTARIEPHTHNCSRNETCSSTSETATADDCETEDSISYLSSYEDTLVLASSASLHVLIRRVEEQGLEQSSLVLPHQQQQPKQHPSKHFEGGNRSSSRIEFVFNDLTLQTPVVSVGCGLNHIVLATADGRALALGVNSSGQLGDGSFIDKRKFAQVQLEEQFKAVSVHAGREFSFAICRSCSFPRTRTPHDVLDEPEKKRRDCRTDKPVEKGGDVLFAWGRNDYGQLGQAASFTSTCSCLPKQVESPIPNAIYTDVACASGHVVVLTADGFAVSFGLNIHGQLGNGSVAPTGAPGVVPVPFPVRAVSCSDCSVLALSDKGIVFSWGVEPTYQPPPPVRFPAAWPRQGGSPAKSDCATSPSGSLLESPIELQNADTAEPLLSEPDSPDAGTNELADGTRSGTVPFSHSPGFHRVEGLPGAASVVAAGTCKNFAICISPDSGSYSEALCTWLPSVGDGNNGTVPVCSLAQFPPFYVGQKGAEMCGRRKLKWYCSSNQRNVLIWARAGPAENITRASSSL